MLLVHVCVWRAVQTQSNIHIAELVTNGVQSLSDLARRSTGLEVEHVIKR